MARQTSYTVHLPPAGRAEDEAIQFVPDSFSPLAFFFPWAWFPLQRMWLVTLAYLALMGLTVLALSLAGLSPLLRTMITTTLSLLIGLEATNLKRWTLGRRGWREVAVVVAGSQDEAERRYFAERGAAAPAVRTEPRFAASVPAAPLSSQPVIGLFPEAAPGARGIR
jgi:hypothetical protein